MAGNSPPATRPSTRWTLIAPRILLQAVQCIHRPAWTKTQVIRGAGAETPRHGERSGNSLTTSFTGLRGDLFAQDQALAGQNDFGLVGGRRDVALNVCMPHLRTSTAAKENAASPPPRRRRAPAGRRYAAPPGLPRERNPDEEDCAEAKNYSAQLPTPSRTAIRSRRRGVG